MDPALVGLIGTAIASGVSVASTHAANKKREQQQERANKLARENRLNEDSDKVESLRRAGLSPNLAYGGGTPIDVQPAEVDKADTSSLDNMPSSLANIVQQNPVAEATAQNIKATTEKTEAETKAIELSNSDKSGENEGAYFKLQQFGLKPSDLKVENASGYLRSLDFADEHVTKGTERGLRKLSAQLDSQIKTKCLTDSSWNKKFQDAYAAGLESLMLDPQLKRADLTSKKQNNALFNLRKLNLSAEYKLKLNQSSKTSIEGLKGLFDIEKVKAETKIANENSFQNILSHIHSAYVRDDAEELADWLIIGGVKSGGFDSLTQMFHSVTSDSMDAIKLYQKLKKGI